MDGRKRGSARLKTVKSETRMRDKDTWVGDSKADLINNIKTGSGRQRQCQLTGWLASMTALEKACSISEKKFSDNPVQPFPGRYLVIVHNTLGSQVMLYWTYNAFRHITVT